MSVSPTNLALSLLCRRQPIGTNNNTRLQSQKYDLENTYWKTFDPYVIPLLDKPMDLRRFEELDTSGSAAGAHYHEEAKGDTTVASMYNDTI